MPDPSRDPERKLAEKKAAEGRKRMKFENEAQERDYMKAVNANPNNIPGLPTFFPPTTIKSSYSRSDWNCEAHGHRWSNTQQKWCLSCGIDKVEP